MIAPTILNAIADIQKATTFSDLVNGSGDAKATFRIYAKAVHPDTAPSRYVKRAEAAFGQLKRLYDEFENGDAGRTSAPTTIVTKRRAYVFGSKIADGDMSALYRASYHEDDVTHAVTLKVTRDSRNNDLAQNEAKVLRHLAEHMETPLGLPYVSQLLDSFGYRDAATGVTHQVNALASIGEGWYTLSQVKTAYPDGLDIRDVMWMWKRLLIAVGHAHRAGVVHGAVVPEHVLINGPAHGLMLVDWSYARIEPFGALSAIVPHRRSMYPPEVLNKESVSASTDIFMSARTIETLFNDATPTAFRRFIKGCTDARPEDAWQLMHELSDLALSHFPRRFRPFEIPKGTE